ncbi:hypothetical protein HPP92_027657 [Vanilla planifolia]|uniref:Uncharacterized protein n=1 Tax=Vanilla planifolia TaxID=51239 RepID=A0A835U7A6_VANPL|nr:hypothetical protein HPP92_027657 [Vanilla planifolia]
MCKAEFDKLCFLILGRENLQLHNQLIQSVIRNAFQSKTPPPLKRFLQREDGLKPAHPPALSNGDVLPQSPRRRRSGAQRSRLGICERADGALHENGNFVCHDLKSRQEAQHSGQAVQSLKRCQENVNGIEQPVAQEDGEYMVQRDDLNFNRCSLQAPFGIPFFPTSVGGAKRSLPSAGGVGIAMHRSFADDGELCHTENLRKRMEMIMESHNIGRVELGCANLLNNALDAYLKRLIKSAVDLVRTRVDHENLKQTFLRKAQGKPINGIWLDSSTRVYDSISPLDLQERNCSFVTLQDFCCSNVA